MFIFWIGSHNLTTATIPPAITVSYLCHNKDIQFLLHISISPGHDTASQQTDTIMETASERMKTFLETIVYCLHWKWLEDKLHLALYMECWPVEAVHCVVMFAMCLYLCPERCIRHSARPPDYFLINGG